MVKLELLEILQQDVEDIKGLVNYDDYGMTIGEMKKQSKGIISNLQNHLNELVQNL